MIISMQKGGTSISCVAHLVAFGSLLIEIIFVLSIGGLWGSSPSHISSDGRHASRIDSLDRRVLAASFSAPWMRSETRCGTARPKSGPCTCMRRKIAQPYNKVCDKTCATRQIRAASRVPARSDSPLTDSASDCPLVM